ncbi:hypothetical protein [Clostridium transplantifaecale]|uniref:hypothetical protein n=1 Tax=Clostridium transplantifaecale TaxID=2479838 RepID=UPI000F6420C5|nr:hypothetical protein [Clostridium transplantifaecale]
MPSDDGCIFANYSTTNNQEKVKYGFLPVNNSTSGYSAQQQVKLQEMRRLNKEFGGNVGNILAQQYGLNSECLDITSDLKAACFFATHQYPHYEIYSGGDDLGVIYRFKMGTQQFSYTGIETMKSMLFEINSPYPYLFGHHRKALDEQQMMLIDEYKPYRPAITFTPFVMINFPKVRDIIYSYVSENNSGGFLTEFLETTRLFKQSGGFMISAIYYLASIPVNTTTVYNEQLQQNINKPGLAILDKMIGIEDVSKYSFVEKFYFHQGALTSDTISVNREELWPSVKHDYYFNLIARMITLSCSDYLEKYNTNYDDQVLGVLDRGYY